MSKVLKKVIANQLTKYQENNELYHSMQFGFRKKCSTEMALCHFTERVKCSLDNGSVVGAVFLDLKKAFDTVSHEILVSKLRHQFNFSDLAAANWLSSYLAHRQQCVRLQNVKTPPQNINIGLPQGSVLGPILFCLYINDLPSVCKDTECQMYADDTVFYVSANNSYQASEILSRQMVTVSEWLQRNHLTLNYKKTVSMCFSIRKKVTEKFCITIDRKEIEVVNEFKY